MIKRALVASAILAPVLYGCEGGQQQAKTEAPAPPANSSQPSTASNPEPASKPPVANKTPESPAPAIVPKSSPPPKPLTASQAKDPIAIAKRMDQMLATLSNVKAQTRTRITIGQGYGGTKTTASIGGPGTFDIEYLAFDGRVPTTGYLRADGKRVGELIKGAPQKPGESSTAKTSKEMGWTTAPVRRLKPKLAAVAPLQPFDIARVVFAGLADGTPSFTNYLTALRKAGYKVTVGERSTMVGNRVVRNYVIRGAKGGDKLEMVVDSKLFLPVTINASAKSVNGKPETFQWSTAWQNGVKFDKGKFQLPPD